MLENMMEKVAGLRFENKGAETDSREPTTVVNQDREEAAGNIGKEDTKEICSGATPMATHAYTRNP